MKFCDNPKCENHMEVNDKITDTLQVIDREGKVRTHHRHGYRTSGWRHVGLCDICHAAVQMVIDPARKV